MRFALILLACVTSLHAEDKEVPVKTFHFADQELEKRSAMDEKAQAALRAWIQASKCEYLSPNPNFKYRDVRSLPAKPEIFKMQGCEARNGSRGEIPYCAAKVQCESRFVKYAFKDVFCKALTTKSCPDAKACALATHFTRAFNQDFQSTDGKQKALAKQEMRGWTLGHTTHYSWTAEDEEALQKNVKEQQGDENE